MTLNNFLSLCEDAYLCITVSYIGADEDIKYRDYADVRDIPRKILNSNIAGWATGSNGIVVRVDYTEL